MKINGKILIATIIAGLLAGVVDLFLYNALVDDVSRFLLIPILFAVLAVFVCATIFVIGLFDRDGGEDFLFLEGRAQLIAGLFTLLVVLFFGAMGLEAWYEAESEKKGTVQLPQASSYIFVLDESGSMYGNDPRELRNTAVNSVMAAVDASTPYAVYVFGSTPLSAREMKPYAEGEYVPDDSIINQAGAGTAICDALELVLNDYRNGAFASCGETPRVILLSDGEDYELSGTRGDGMADSYKSEGIAVSTVYLHTGFSGGDAYDALERFAEKTGGVCTEVSNSRELVRAFGNAASVNLDGGRDLFSERNQVSSEFLYALLRIFALTILGGVVCLMKACALAKDNSTALVLIVGIIASLIGAVLVEVFTLMGLPLAVGIVLYCVLVAATPSYLPAPITISEGHLSYYR